MDLLFIHCRWLSNSFSTIYLKRLSFLYKIIWIPVLYSSVDMNLDLFLNSLFCMLIYMPLLTPILYYLNYCSFVVIHTVRKCEHFDSVLPYKNYFGSSMPLLFHITFIISFPISTGNIKTLQNFNKDYTESVDQFGQNWHVKNICISL